MNILKTGICPYCDRKLELIPSRKKKCTFCGEFIFVRTRPLDRQQYLIREEEKNIIEKEWEAWSYKGEGDVGEIIKRLIKRFGTEPSVQDVVWTSLIENAEKFMKESSINALRLWDLSKCYYIQSEFLKNCSNQSSEYIKKIKDISDEIMRRRNRLVDLKDFEGIKNAGILKDIEISVCDDSCEKCRQYKGRKFSLDEIKEKELLPITDCENGWCRCCYSPNFK